jgi:hypothetical protein
MQNVLERVRHEVNKNGCHVCTSHYKDKNGHVNIRVDGKLKFLHRLSYENTYGEIPEGLIVRHKCDEPSCFNPDHLELGTHADNVRDRVERNRSAIGTSNGRAKLDEEKVKEIRNNNDNTIAGLARQYGVDRRVIRDIKQRKTWKHVV